MHAEFMQTLLPPAPLATSSFYLVFVSFYSLDSFHLYFFACQRLSLTEFPPPKLYFSHRVQAFVLLFGVFFSPSSPPLVPSAGLSFFTSVLTPSVFLSMGLCKTWGSMALCCGFQSHFLPCSSFLFLLLTHKHTYTHNSHTHAHTHTPHHLGCGIFSPAHAECVISFAWCPPLEKRYLVPAGSFFFFITFARLSALNPTLAHLPWSRNDHYTRLWVVKVVLHATSLFTTWVQVTKKNLIIPQLCFSRAGKRRSRRYYGFQLMDSGWWTTKQR